MNAADAYTRHLWQVFSPGCITEERGVSMALVPFRIIEVSCDVWVPLRNGQILFKYIFDGEDKVREYTFTRFSTAKISYLMNPIVEGDTFGSLDTPVCLLHLFDDSSKCLNHGLIKKIGKGTILRMKNSILSVKQRSAMGKSEILNLKHLVETAPFPAKFSYKNIDKQLAAGFIPRLENYYNVSADQMLLLVRNIARGVIGKHTGISFFGSLDEERDDLTMLLREHFGSYFPGSTVNNVPHPSSHPPPRLVIKNGWLNEVVLHAGLDYLMILTFPPMQQRLNNLSIQQHLFTEALTFPHLIPFKLRRFSGLSSVIYNATKQSIELQDYRPLVREAVLTAAVKMSANVKIIDVDDSPKDR